MWTRLRFSLRTVLIAMAFTILGTYCLLPIPTEIYCDPMYQYSSRYSKTAEDIMIDIQGRNDKEPFQTLVKSVRVISSEPSDDRQRGLAKVSVYLTLYASRKLKSYKILRIRAAR